MIYLLVFVVIAMLLFVLVIEGLATISSLRLKEKDLLEHIAKYKHLGDSDDGTLSNFKARVTLMLELKRRLVLIIVEIMACLTAVAVCFNQYNGLG